MAVHDTSDFYRDRRPRRRPRTAHTRILDELISGLEAANAGDFSTVILAHGDPRMVEAAAQFNQLMARQQRVFDEFNRVSRSVGREGKMRDRAAVSALDGEWAVAVESVNLLISDLVQPTFEVSRVIKAVAEGDLSQKVELEIAGKEVQGEFFRIGSTVNRMVDQLNAFASEVTRVAREVGTEGVLGGQANVPEVGGTWKDLTDSVNAMASNLTNQVRNVALVTTAVANGDLSQHIMVEARGEMLELKNTINTMVDQLSAFAAEVTRVAREVGTEGVLGGQATVTGVAGTWKGLTENVNAMAANLTNQVRNIALVTTAVANGDLSQKIAVEARGEMLDLKNTINDMVEKLRIFANEVIRVAIEVGTEGRLGGQAAVPGVGGTWKDLTENVNAMAGNLTIQVRNIADVTTAVARGDLSRKITVDVRGEILELKNTVNAMVDQLNAFAGEVTRVAREVGTEGKLGGQARVPGAAGVWDDLTNNVNSLAANLTTQVRNIADVTTAVANGDLSQKITVEAQGEVLSLKMTINDMVDRLRVFGDEVTRVAKEVGTEGRLGGQAEVPSVSGTWKMLTDSVNAMANSLTVQVRNIADVTTAVTKGDLTRQITVNARGELDELKQNMNQMISNLRETTQTNQEQDWLKTNLAKFAQMLQGEKDLQSISQLVMSELTPLLSAQTGAFFLMEREDSTPTLRLIASYAYRIRKQAHTRYALGEGLVGQAAYEKKQIIIPNPPDDYIEVASGLGKAPPRNIVVLPILFEGEVKAVIELASFQSFSETHQSFLDQLAVSLGVVLNMIQTSMRTEELLQQSQKLAQELQSSSTELRDQQDELKHSNRELEAQARTLQESQTLLRQQQEELRHVNAELEEKAVQLAEQNTNVEQKNREVEAARVALEEKAEQLAVSSRYKSEFLANVSHEFRTPLNSLLILAKLLAENKDGKLSKQQVEFAETIYSSGRDLLGLINDVLDLSKVEAGKMAVDIRDVAFADVRELVERTFQPLAQQKGLRFMVHVDPDLPATVRTDRQRLEQVLKNLISNAIKFTERGEVVLDIRPADPGRRYANRLLDASRSEGIVAFAVRDTGIGIPPEKQQSIFEAFQQVNGTINRKYGGTGLGLSISREIATLLHGEIAVESEPDRGSTFVLYLPFRYVPREGEYVESPPSPAPPSAQPAPPPRTEPRPTPTHRVLVVAADQDTRDDIARRVSGDGAAVAQASEAADALVELRKGGYDRLAISLGGTENDLDGFGLLESLRSDPDLKDLRIVLDVARGLTPDEEEHIRNLSGDLALATVTSRDQLPEALGGAAAPEETATDQHRAGAQPTAPEPSALSGKHVLIVDDDVRNIFSLTSMLEDRGMTVSFAENGRDAITLLDSTPGIDAVLMDIMMPDMDGYETTRAIRMRPRFAHLPIIALTAKAMKGDRENALAAGASDYIAKPVESDQLVQMLASWVTR